MAEYSDDEDARGIVATVKSTITTPIHALTSKPARRAYISTALLLSTAIILAGIAITAYTLFYFAYIPTRGFSRPIHLQFAPTRAGHHPYGTASLSHQLVSGQKYDVSVVLHLPRTPANREAGNFMLDLRLLALARGGGGVLGLTGEEDEAVRLLAHERRPAILTYYSPVVEYAHKAVELPWYMLHWRREAETLHVPMFEGVEFAKGWRNVPDLARLELQSEEKMQVYSARVVFTARFGGLRYFMYNHRILAFTLMTSTFWTVEMTFTFAAWLILSFLVFPRSESGPVVKRGRDEDGRTIKEEGTDEETIDDLSDTSRTFPTYSRQPPLRYSSPRIKKEEEEEGSSALQAIPPAVEADDEEDDDFVLDDSAHLGGGRSDSGLGTSMESSVDRRDSVRRRRSRLFGGSRNP